MDTTMRDDVDTERHGPPSPLSSTTAGGAQSVSKGGGGVEHYVYHHADFTGVTSPNSRMVSPTYCAPILPCFLCQRCYYEQFFQLQCNQQLQLNSCPACHQNHQYYYGYHQRQNHDERLTIRYSNTNNHPFYLSYIQNQILPLKEHQVNAIFICNFGALPAMTLSDYSLYLSKLFVKSTTTYKATYESSSNSSQSSSSLEKNYMPLSSDSKQSSSNIHSIIPEKKTK